MAVWSREGLFELLTGGNLLFPGEWNDTPVTVASVLVDLDGGQAVTLKNNHGDKVRFWRRSDGDYEELAEDLAG